MRVTVLAGGVSDERAVSLRSGAAVAAALREAGHAVTLTDITPDDPSALDRPADVVWPALHGAFGEDGRVQHLIEAHGLPYVGSGPAASALAFDKQRTKDAWRAAGLPVADDERVRPGGSTTLAPPCIVKPVAGGSSLGVSICHTAAERDAAVAAAAGDVLVERLIDGPEWTVGIVDGRALPPIWIDSGGGWFDYANKYNPDGSRHRFDLDDLAHRAAEVRQLCLDAHHALGCRHLSRVDLMFDRAGRLVAAGAEHDARLHRTARCSPTPRPTPGSACQRCATG